MINPEVTWEPTMSERAKIHITLQLDVIAGLHLEIVYSLALMPFDDFCTVHGSGLTSIRGITRINFDRLQDVICDRLQHENAPKASRHLLVTKVIGGSCSC
nr:hypothetical protein CFP56_19660 [Quercus suber]